MLGAVQAVQFDVDDTAARWHADELHAADMTPAVTVGTMACVGVARADQAIVRRAARGATSSRGWTLDARHAPVCRLRVHVGRNEPVTAP